MTYARSPPVFRIVNELLTSLVFMGSMSGVEPLCKNFNYIHLKFS